MKHAVASVFEIDTYPDCTNADGTENINYDYQTKWFSVPEAWAKEWINNLNGEEDLEKVDFEYFKNEYTWDDTLQMYYDACSDGVLIEEHIEARGSSAVQLPDRTDEEAYYPKLCGFVWCHGSRDFSAYEVNLSRKDQEAIEEILSHYETEGSSLRNCYDYTFNTVFCECY